MRRRGRRTGWRTWVLGAVGAAVAGAVLARRSETLAQLRARARARLLEPRRTRPPRPALALPAVTPGAQSAAPVAPRPPATLTLPAAAPVASAAAPPATPASATAWVASRLGSTYYRADCRAALRLAAANRLEFASEAEAQAAGYRRSTAAGC